MLCIQCIRKHFYLQNISIDIIFVDDPCAGGRTIVWANLPKQSGSLRLVVVRRLPSMRRRLWQCRWQNRPASTSRYASLHAICANVCLKTTGIFAQHMRAGPPRLAGMHFTCCWLEYAWIFAVVYLRCMYNMVCMRTCLQAHEFLWLTSTHTHTHTHMQGRRPRVIFDAQRPISDKKKLNGGPIFQADFESSNLQRVTQVRVVVCVRVCVCVLICVHVIHTYNLCICT
jgi:hypothetical protein